MSDDAIPSWQEATRRIAAACAAAGLDLVHPLRADWYDDAVEEPHRLPDVGRRDALAVLVASTRALWPCFLDALRREPSRLESSDPLDGYVTQAVTVAAHAAGAPCAVRFAHEPPPRVAIQRLAHVSGFARLAPSHLNVHPVHGPWVALRAVVVADVPGPPGRPPAPVDPCGGCETRCMAALERALEATGGRLDQASLATGWRAWLAVRDACPAGVGHRYDESQIRYTYTKDRRALLDAVRALR